MVGMVSVRGINVELQIECLLQTINNKNQIMNCLAMLYESSDLVQSKLKFLFMLGPYFSPPDFVTSAAWSGVLLHTY